MLRSIAMTINSNLGPKAVPGSHDISLAFPFKVTDGDSNCVVMARDIEILLAIERYRIISLEQVWAAFFSYESPMRLESLFLMDRGSTGGHLNVTYQRMTKLTSMGYIERNHRRGFAHIYRLALAGQQLLATMNRSRFKRVPAWPEEVRHPLMVAGTGLFLSKFLGLKVTPERELLADLWTFRQANRNFIPTPVPDLKISNASAELRVEVELSEKRPPRYATLWRQLGDGLRTDVPSVLYLVPDRASEERLLSLARKEYFPGIYVTNVERLCHDGYSVAWRNFNGERFHLAGNFGSAGV